jgi:uncharacterized RDD family membrane protein YckC
MRYYVGQDGKQLGPFEDAQVRALLAAGSLRRTDLGWREGLAEWQPLGQLFPLDESAPPPVPGAFVPPPQAGAPIFQGQGARPGDSPFISDITREPLQEGPSLAGRGRRLLAVSLDHLAVLILAAPGLVMFLSSFLPFFMATIADADGTMDEAAMEAAMAEFIGENLVGAVMLMLIPIAIFTLVQVVLVSMRGQTVGKILCKIRIVRSDGSSVGFLHGVLLRSIVMGMIGAVPLVGGFVSIADPLFIFREDRRCLHDMLADTIVVDV